MGFRVSTLEYCIVVFRVLCPDGFQVLASYDPKLCSFYSLVVLRYRVRQFWGFGLLNGFKAFDLMVLPFLGS